MKINEREIVNFNIRNLAHNKWSGYVSNIVKLLYNYLEDYDNSIINTHNYCMKINEVKDIYIYFSSCVLKITCTYGRIIIEIKNYESIIHYEISYMDFDIEQLIELMVSDVLKYSKFKYFYFKHNKQIVLGNNQIRRLYKVDNETYKFRFNNKWYLISADNIYR